MKTIEENNRMIAEFMGMQLTSIGWFDNESNLCLPNTMDNTFDELLFHTSWDWLMPVIKTIREQICVDMCFDDFDDWRDNFKQIDPYNYSLEHCYLAVFQFIEWYNENK